MRRFPHHGFARIRCEACGHDYLLAYSCKARYFCPSCHQKRVLLYGEWVERIMAPRFVAPYRKSGKNDGNDAEAICEAVQRPSMRFVPVKSAEQQALLSLHRVRQGFVEERTATINRIRAVLCEFGVVLPHDARQVRRAATAAAEAAIHQTRLDDARLELEAAAAHFGEDRIGRGDAALCAALLANARGEAGDALRHADDAARLFGEADATERGDREDVARAYAALASVYADPPSSPSRLQALEARPELPAVAEVIAGVTRSLQHFNRGDHIAVVKALEPLAQQALRLGMLQLRLRIGNTIAAAYSNLDDKEAAISWVEESLDLARAAAWPVATGEALAFLGNFYREVGQIDRALETLEQARSTLRLAPRSRGYALACCYYAHAQLAAGAPALALALADEAVDVANAINAIPIVVDMLTVSARARARLGEPLPACELAMRALELAKSQELVVWQVDVLRALAEIHGEHRLQPPEGVAPGHASLHFLSQAQMVVDSLSGHAEGVAIARELARAYETAGDLRTALQAERAAFAQALSEDARRINNRLLAIEARHQVEKQRMEVLHQRQIAAAEGARAEALARTNSELRAAQAELERLANTDVLTGIANRRHFLSNARAECERALRYGRPLALVMGDIDRFKAINDAWGHPCGDLVIAAAARVMDSQRRSVDSIGRLGGEEFGLLLPEADLATALGVAERVRLAIEAVGIEWEGRPIAFTMSFGLAVLDASAGEAMRDAADALEALISRADGALYAAKAAGRNCVRERADPAPEGGRARAADYPAEKPPSMKIV